MTATIARSQLILRGQKSGKLHRADLVLGMTTEEEPVALADAIPGTVPRALFVVIGCLTLWLASQLMPASSANIAELRLEYAQLDTSLKAISCAPGSVILLGDEIGLDVIPVGREARAFVDAIGRLHQDVAATCQRATLMVAGLLVGLKDIA